MTCHFNDIGYSSLQFGEISALDLQAVEPCSGMEPEKDQRSVADSDHLVEWYTQGDSEGETGVVCVDEVQDTGAKHRQGGTERGEMDQE